MERRKQENMKGKTIVVICSTVLLIGVITILTILYLQKFSFAFGTNIAGVECSALTVEQAKNKIQASKQVISFRFQLNPSVAKYEIYEVEPEDLEKFEYTIPDTKNLEVFLQEQKSHSGEIKFSNEQLFSINETEVRTYLASIFKKLDGKMTQTQNAYIKLNEKNVAQIVPEVYGNAVDFEEAYKLTIESLKRGNTQIDFSKLVKKPDVVSTSENLIQMKEQLNSLLSTNLIFKLSNGNEVKLTAEEIKGWMKSTVEETLSSVDEHISLFVDNLAEKSDEANSKMVFQTTGKGKITMPVTEDIRAKLDKEKMITLIKEAIGTHPKDAIPLSYDRQLVSDKLSNGYVEYDISRQTVWLYNGKGECIMKSPCVTGIVKANGQSKTCTGIYFLTYKATGVTLRGNNDDGSKYASYVNYWMPFCGGIGFHDATWRSSFGGTIYVYNGSHGCVNMPYANAKILYQYINSSMPIIGYQS